MRLTPPAPDRRRVGVIRPKAAYLGHRLLQALRHLATRPETQLWVYLPLTAAVELLISRFGSGPGLLLQALLVAALSYRLSLEGPGPRRNLILATILVPVGRLLVIAQFLVPVSEPVWNLIVGCVLAVAASVVLWQVRLPHEELGWGPIAVTSATLRFRAPRFQLLLGAGGVGLGLLESRYLSAGRLPGATGFFAFILTAFALVVPLFPSV